jgi:hypothetical protein
MYSSTLSLTSGLNVVEWPTLLLANFTPGLTRYPLYWKLGTPQVRSGQVREISLLPGFGLRTVQPVASRYTDGAVSPHNSINVWGRQEVPVLLSALQCRAFPITKLSSLFQRYFQIHSLVINFELDFVLPLYNYNMYERISWWLISRNFSRKHRGSECAKYVILLHDGFFLIIFIIR